MKQFYFSVIAILLFSFAFAAPVNTVNTNGDWSSVFIWSLGRVPASGDTVVVPSGITLSVVSNINNATSTYYIKVQGNLTFNGGKLDIGSGSVINILSGGVLSTTSSNTNRLQIGNVNKYSGGEPNIVGPAYANSSTGTSPNGFTTGILLPVKFAGFSATATSAGNLIQWATAEEVNAHVYEIERSEEGSTWKTIAIIMAVGNSTQLNSYSYTDKSNMSTTEYYRIKQVDRDGKFVYTAVKTLKVQTLASNTQVKVASATNSSLILQFSGEIKGPVLVRLISFSGQVVAQQSYTNPAGQIIYQQALKGAYIVLVSNAQDVHISQKVIL